MIYEVPAVNLTQNPNTNCGSIANAVLASEILLLLYKEKPSA